MKASTRKIWSIRCLRWMEHMPEELINMDVKLKGTKNERKEWIRKSIQVKGDRLLWGQKLTEETRRKRNPARQEDDHESGQEEEPIVEEEESKEEDQLHVQAEVENKDREMYRKRSRGTNQKEMILKKKIIKKSRRDWRDRERQKKRQERGKTL